MIEEPKPCPETDAILHKYRWTFLFSQVADEVGRGEAAGSMLSFAIQEYERLVGPANLALILSDAADVYAAKAGRAPSTAN